MGAHGAALVGVAGDAVAGAAQLPGGLLLLAVLAVVLDDGHLLLCAHRHAGRLAEGRGEGVPGVR